jgi:hypothetical protein
VFTTAFEYAVLFAGRPNKNIGSVLIVGRPNTNMVLFSGYHDCPNTCTQYILCKKFQTMGVKEKYLSCIPLTFVKRNLLISNQHKCLVYYLVMLYQEIILCINIGAIVAMIYGSWIYNYLCSQCISPLTLGI